jgi:osmotically-inducible protein OsmY
MTTDFTSPLPEENDIETRVREALRADASTSRYAERLFLGNRDGQVVVRGTVEEVEDSDAVAAVIGNVDGVTAVVPELEVEGVSD